MGGESEKVEKEEKRENNMSYNEISRIYQRTVVLLLLTITEIMSLYTIYEVGNCM